MVPELRRLSESSKLYQDQSDLEESNQGRRFNEYCRRGGARFKRRYHGTRRACLIGETGQVLEPCDNSECGVCGILKHSFKIPRGRGGSMFGNGVYSTTISSKADMFAENHHIHSTLHAVFICRVVTNRPQYLRHPDNYRTRPDPGFDSVEAVTLRNGGNVAYPETIVYREDAIVPFAVVMYTRQGWLP
ncbi:uncharacterized protein NECHADRAFT_80791 [Fusarium vanettenii 77-13-4]|uniref:PARP catalytic domain-containing protein n=1 Tax=Fusarium vanettenii (strain ATCC MYA-4622 / CBS 123669 / FGSC 9596 / NRRL 45880 / 77-13-4) TaxID=660122 RepID=C7YSM9_FUSV7|nr:uncharacterized protein NECHADRAFT_80791 [Fusarium vanettenii 77-13-4]EEU45273.1 hypothetical protein NECHADRAFT_80791 [Fusarium vanettenii 77-13-4]